MKMILENGYPFPYPANLSETEQEAISETARGVSITLKGIKGVEWLHTLTVEFHTSEAMKYGLVLGWKPWGNGNVLEVPTSGPDGYDHPALIAGNRAYCGFILADE